MPSNVQLKPCHGGLFEIHSLLDVLNVLLDNQTREKLHMGSNTWLLGRTL